MNRTKNSTQQRLFNEPKVQTNTPVMRLAKRGIIIGTSGYSYDDWIGRFYPRGMKRQQMLEYYRRIFPAVEINYTYYQLPSPETLYQLHLKAPEMVFAVKAYKSLTHERKGKKEDWMRFAQALEPLLDADKLAAVLFQFPFSFRLTKENERYLDDLIEFFQLPRVTVEFRHSEWMQTELFDSLRKRGVTICSVDAPNLPGLTGNIVQPGERFSYFRLHGHNKEEWFGGDNTSRYRYAYTKAEIRELISRIIVLRQQTEVVYVFANNHPDGEAVNTALALAMGMENESWA